MYCIRLPLTLFCVMPSQVQVYNIKYILHACNHHACTHIPAPIAHMHTSTHAHQHQSHTCIPAPITHMHTCTYVHQHDKHLNKHQLTPVLTSVLIASCLLRAASTAWTSWPLSNFSRTLVMSPNHSFLREAFLENLSATCSSFSCLGKRRREEGKEWVGDHLLHKDYPTLTSSAPP